ncbi:C40 family peptidase [Calidifontibacillus oryziterrae]|uniref:C40 family peptidase n=1 Tax=Calidifontibacillus oryziterrae TaxID=1191699 RepID=UPI0002D44AEA|nr:C40 family peptidase [Calidifontibacillus oryziterrae]
MKKVFTLFFATFLLLTVFSTNTMASSEESEDMAGSIIESATQYIGVPYKDAGSSPKGFDCSGFVKYVFDEVGVSLNDQRTSRGQYTLGESVKKADLKAGDLVFFNTSGSGISHVGIYKGNNEFIHSASNKGVMTSSINDPYYWGSRYVGAKRIINN